MTSLFLFRPFPHLALQDPNATFLCDEQSNNNQENTTNEQVQLQRSPYESSKSGENQQHAEDTTLYPASNYKGGQPMAGEQIYSNMSSLIKEQDWTYLSIQYDILIRAIEFIDQLESDSRKDFYKPRFIVPLVNLFKTPSYKERQILKVVFLLCSFLICIWYPICIIFLHITCL
jgi:hypothetical protein